MRQKHAVLYLMIWILAFPLAATGNEAPKQKERPGAVHEFRLGVLGHDVDRMWSNLRRENGVDYNAEIILTHPNGIFFYGEIRPSIGVSLNDKGDTSKLYAGMLWEKEYPYGLFLNLGIGFAIHNGELETNREDRKSLGARCCFRIPFEAGISLTRHHRISIAFDHISNGYLASPNEGMDTLGVRYGYRF